MLSIWVGLEELLSDFSLKPFVEPTPTPQSYYEMAYSAMGRRRCLCSEVTLHD